jgi:hypothetical protein
MNRWNQKYIYIYIRNHVFQAPFKGIAYKRRSSTESTLLAIIPLPKFLYNCPCPLLKALYHEIIDFPALDLSLTDLLLKSFHSNCRLVSYLLSCNFIISNVFQSFQNSSWPNFLCISIVDHRRVSVRQIVSTEMCLLRDSSCEISIRFPLLTVRKVSYLTSNSCL